MLLKEAKQILKKNGYKLVEAYDAVHHHSFDKGKDRWFADGYDVTHNLIRALKEVLGEYKYNVKYMAGDQDIYIKDSNGNFIAGVSVNYNYDSRKVADEEDPMEWSVHQNKCRITVFFEEAPEGGNPTATFDARNIPSMVDFVLDHI